MGGATLAEIANGSYQWFDMSRPGNENKTWHYRSIISAGIVGALSLGRNIPATAGIALGGTLFSDGLDKGALLGSGAGWAFGTTIGLIAPPMLDPIFSSQSGFMSDMIGSFGGEFFGNTIKEEVNEKKK